MTHYRYSDSKIIDEVTFRQSGNGAIRAYLHACAGADPETLKTIVAKLKSVKLDCVPFAYGGLPEAEVRGFKEAEDLLRFMKRKGWINGKPEITTPPEEHLTWLDRLKKRTLQLSGVAFILGDWNFFRYGWKQSQVEEMAAGVAYAGGTAALVLYGRNDQSELQVRELAQKIADHMKEKGVTVTPGAAILHTTRREPKTLMDRVDNTFRRYPSEMFSLFTFMAGALVAIGSARHKLLAPPDPKLKLDDQGRFIRKVSGWLDVGLGTLTMVSTSLAGLVKEKAHDPDKPRAKGFAGWVEWFKEKPLTVASYGLMGSTMMHAVSTGLDYREARRLHKSSNDLSAILNRGWFVGSNLVAEGLMSVSSKGHGEGVVSDKSVDATAIALTADMIVRQPLAKQEELIAHMAEFLGRADVLAMKNAETAELLRAQVETLRKNPWVEAEAKAVQPQPSEPAKEPSTQLPAPEVASWQDRQSSRAADPAAPVLGA